MVVTRAREQAGVLTSRLAELGASVIEAPAIAIRPARSWKLPKLDRYWGVVFTSANAVDPFFNRLRDARKLAGRRVLVIGSGTAKAVRARSISPDFVSPVQTVEHLAGEIAKRLPAGARLLHPCGNLANPLLRERFRCDDVVVYRIEAGRGAFPTQGILGSDLITFASSETVRRFAEAGDGPVRKVPTACIGPVTARTARAAGFRVAATAKPHTIDGLVRAVRKVFR